MGGRGATVQQRITTTLFRHEIGRNDDGTPQYAPGLSTVGVVPADAAAKAVGFKDIAQAQATFAKFMRRGVKSISKVDKRRLDRLPPEVRGQMYDGLKAGSAPAGAVTSRVAKAHRRREIVRKKQTKQFGKAPVRKVSKSVFKQHVARALKEPVPFTKELPSVGTVVRRRIYGPDGQPTLRTEFFTVDH